jgi:sulfide:quinone oxidoreductase
MAKRVVILGAGIGGIASAHELLKQLKRRHELVMIDQAERYEFSPSFPWILSGDRTLSQISVPFSPISRKGVQFRQETIRSIDPNARTVTTDRGTVEADYLLIALGAHTHMGGLGDVERKGHNLYTAEGAKAICDLSSRGGNGRAIVLVCSMPFKCPAAPYEAAMLWQARLKRHGARTEVAIYTPEPGPMPVAGETVSAQLKDMLARKGIAYFPKHTIKGLDNEGQLEFAEGRGAFDYLGYVPKHSVPPLLIDAGLAPAGGWVAVDRYTMRTPHPGVYAVGDCVGIPLKNGKALPKAGVFAHGQAHVAARNIAEEIEGRQASHRYDGHGECFVEMGGLMAGRGAGNFYAEPNPEVSLSMPGPWHHFGKVLFEKYWLNLMY